MHIRGCGSGLTILVVSLVILAVGCAPAAAPPVPTPGSKVGEESKPAPKPAAQVDKVRIHNPGTGGTYQFYSLGKQQGFFKEAGMELELLVMKVPLTVPAILSGEVDYTAVASSSFEAGLQGAPIKQVMSTIKKADFFIVVRPEIRTAQDLKGKNLALGSVATVDGYATKQTLKALGLDPEKDVTYLSILDTDRLAALKSGSVSAISVKANLAMRALADGFKELAFTADYVDVISNGLATHDRKLKENPGQVKRMIKTTLKSMAFYRDRAEETVSYLMKEFNMDRKTAEGTREAQVRTTSFDGNFSEKGVQAMVDMARALGTIKGPVSLEKAMDFTALREVQKELNLPLQPDLKIQ